MFSEKYKKDNELITAGEHNLEAIKKMNDKNKSSTKNRSRRILISALASAACLLIAAVCGVALLGGEQGGKAPTVVTSPVRVAKDYNEIFGIIDAFQNRDTGIDDYFAMTGESVVENGAGDMAFESSPAPEANEGSSHSETNTQVAGVDESDIIKTDGEFIYRITGRKLVIVRAEDMKTVSEIGDLVKDDNAWDLQMYVSRNRLALLYTYDEETEKDGETDWYRWENRTRIRLFDISDRSSPKETGFLSQSGSLLTSRLIGDKLYIITNDYRYSQISEDAPQTFIPTFDNGAERSCLAPSDICILPDCHSVSYTVVGAIDITGEAGYKSAKASFGGSGTVYCDTERLIIACSSTENETSGDEEDVIVNKSSTKTDLMVFRLSDGDIEEIATGTVAGSLLNQFSIDRRGGTIRVVVTIDNYIETIYTAGLDKCEFESTRSNALFVLDDDLKPLGELTDLAKDERVYSVRFDGDIAYFVTFKQVDPLFSVDLSDPASPKLLGALKIPGFSQYLHKYGDGLLFGLGRNADEETGFAGDIKLSMFDVSDPANVTEKLKATVEGESFSDALYDHKAILVSPERELIAFPVDQGYLVYGYNDERGFYKRADVAFSDDWYGIFRGLFIGDYFYICSEQKLCKYAIDGFSLVAELVINDETAINDMTKFNVE